MDPWRCARTLLQDVPIRTTAGVCWQCKKARLRAHSRSCFRPSRFPACARRRRPPSLARSPCLTHSGAVRRSSGARRAKRRGRGRALRPPGQNRWPSYVPTVPPLGGRLAHSRPVRLAAAPCPAVLQAGRPARERACESASLDDPQSFIAESGGRNRRCGPGGQAPKMPQDTHAVPSSTDTRT